jgi:DEAD/DEAH box helicase domain-containing protein
MLPLRQAYEVKQSIIEYLKVTFEFKEKAVSKAFYDFIESPTYGIFMRPYISLKLPFEKETG